MLGYVVFFFYFYFHLSSFSTASPVSTSETLSPLWSSDSLPRDSESIYECNEIFKKHLEDYTIRTRFVVPKELDDFYTSVFIKAVLFAAGTFASFDEVIFDGKISVAIHCFLLEYFLLVLRQDDEGFCYSQFVRKYSDSIALTHLARNEDIQVIYLHVFPLLKELVFTGNFLNYSFLLSTCVGGLNSDQKDQIYSSHCFQYFSRINERETEIALEIFKCGLEFINLYIPRCEILSLAGIDNYETIASFKPFGFYLVAFNPLWAVVEGRVVVDLDLERVKKSPLVYGNEIEFFSQLESFLTQIDFLSYTNLEQFNARKSVLSALINFENILLLVNCRFITCFLAWIQFQYTSLDDWNKVLLKASCYGSVDKRFKELYDLYIKE